jgi:rfaE bifunctional protein nucleotidyltransferase chain/domain
MRLDVSDLEAWARKRRELGERIVLANGAFDMLHVGHLRYLRAARQEGDTLLVAVNSDLSVQASKGPDRPIVPEAERQELVEGLACVDYTVLFSDRTVEGIIRSVKPDVHAKGTDYTESSVPEGDLVRSLGGRVAIVGDPKNHSTTELVEKLQTNQEED